MIKRHSIVCAAYLLLFQDDKVLLLRRFNTGYEDGKYSVPAGHVDKGESVSDALMREVKEEIGIDIEKVELVHVMHRQASETNDERLDFFFTCKLYGGEIKNSEPHKCDDLNWFSVENLPENTILYIRQGIEKAIKKEYYSEIGW